jgi:peroxiredoxin
LNQQKGLAVGDVAPDFTLKDQHGGEVSLSGFNGKKVILSFHPLAWTSICAEQMKSLEANAQTFDELNTVAMGMSVDAVPSKKAWAESLGIEKTKLLSDFWPHGEVAQAYSNFVEKLGFSGRANVIVDENRKIVFYKIYEIKELPDIQEIIDFLNRKT